MLYPIWYNNEYKMKELKGVRRSMPASQAGLKAKTFTISIQVYKKVKEVEALSPLILLYFTYLYTKLLASNSL